MSSRNPADCGFTLCPSASVPSVSPHHWPNSSPVSPPGLHRPRAGGHSGLLETHLLPDHAAELLCSFLLVSGERPYPHTHVLASIPATAAPLALQSLHVPLAKCYLLSVCPHPLANSSFCAHSGCPPQGTFPTSHPLCGVPEGTTHLLPWALAPAIILYLWAG